MKKHILLVGEKYSSNLGDGVICEVVENIFKSKKFEIINFDISGRTEYSKENNEFNLKKENLMYMKYNLKKVLSFFGYSKNGKNFEKIFRKFKQNFSNIVAKNKIDSVVFAGGQMFIDTFIYQINYICNYCEKNNIDVIFNCCGSGFILNKAVLQNVLNSEAVKYISVRDSYEKLKLLTRKEINDCYDSAILSSKIYKKAIKPKFEYGVGIMFSTLQPPRMQVQFWKKMIKELVNSGVEFRIFTNGSYKDYSFAKYILNKMNLDYKLYLINQPTNPEELINLVLKFQKILSMRLHSMIIAYSYDIPAISISWDKKVNTFFEKIGLKNNCYSLKSNQKEILQAILSLDYNCINKKIKNNINIKICNNFEIIASLIGKKNK